MSEPFNFELKRIFWLSGAESQGGVPHKASPETTPTCTDPPTLHHPIHLHEVTRCNAAPVVAPEEWVRVVSAVSSASARSLGCLRRSPAQVAAPAERACVVTAAGSTSARNLDCLLRSLDLREQALGRRLAVLVVVAAAEVGVLPAPLLLAVRVAREDLEMAEDKVCPLPDV